MINLTPNVYRNLKWSLAPQNRVDTVYMYPTLNTLADTPTTHVTSVTSIRLDDEDVTLPVDDTRKSTHLRTMKNERKLWFSMHECCKARTECIMASGVQIVHIDEAISGTPQVKIVPKGHSYVSSRGQSNYDTFPAMSSITNMDYQIVPWITEHADVHNTESLVNDYTTGYVNMNPWVRRIVPAVITSLTDISVPTAADILTTWVNPDQGGTVKRFGALASDWIDKNNFDAGALTVNMFPTNPSGGDIAEVYQCALRLQDLRINYSCSLRKLSDFDFEITWTAPVRFAYIAASRQYGPLAGDYELDNYAYVDIINSLDITLEFFKLNDSRIDLSYSLDADNKLTTNTKNIYPLKLESSEIFSRDALYIRFNQPWCELLALNLMLNYMQGEFIVQCEVPAAWALRRSVHIGTKATIYLLDGNFIPDKTTQEQIPATFYVKNIRKIFNNNQFTYELKLSTKGE